MLKKLPAFVAIKSKDNIVFSLILLAFALLMITACVSLLLGSVYILFAEVDEPFFLKLVILLVSLVLNGIWVYLWKRSARTRYTDITINEKGLFYYNRYTGKPVREVQWGNFTSRDGYAIEVLQPGKGIHSLWWWQTIEPLRRQETFMISHLYPAVFKNRRELIATLLLGMAHFRPDLTIDPKIFPSFYIDEHTYVFKRKEIMKEYLFVFLFCLVIVLVLLFWMSRK